MSGGNTGLGTGSQTFNAGGNTSSFSQTNPYGPTQPGISNIINQITAAGNYGPNGQPLSSGGALNSQESGLYNQAISNVNKLPNFGPAAAQTASNIFQTGGDPTGILRREASSLNPLTEADLDPTRTPGMANVLKTIQNDISNQVNGQFAGAGRSLSGLNTQTLSRGLAQGEAVPLMNQYNQNVSNRFGANSLLNNVSQSAMGNLGQGANFAQLAPQLAQLNPMMAQQLVHQRNLAPLNYVTAYENAYNPLAGLGGSVSGTQQSNQSGSGTATNSILGQLGQAAGLINPFGGLLGTLFG